MTQVGLGLDFSIDAIRAQHFAGRRSLHCFVMLCCFIRQEHVRSSLTSLQSETQFAWFADDSADSAGDSAFVERDHEFPGMVCSII